MDTLWDLDFEVKHRPGTSNSNADGLSRQAWSDQDASFDGVGDVMTINIVGLTRECTQRQYLGSSVISRIQSFCLFMLTYIFHIISLIS